MKYIIRKGTPLFKALGAVNEKMKKADRAAMALARKWMGVAYAKNRFELAGGIDAIMIPEGIQVQGFRRVEGSGGYWYALRRTKGNKVAQKLINDLPTVNYDELNKLLKFPEMHMSNTADSFIVQYCPEVFFGSAFHIVAIPEDLTDYKPMAGMEEIPVSKYLSLKAKLGKK